VRALVFVRRAALDRRVRWTGGEGAVWSPTSGWIERIDVQTRTLFFRARALHGGERGRWVSAHDVLSLLVGGERGSCCERVWGVLLLACWGQPGQRRAACTNSWCGSAALLGSRVMSARLGASWVRTQCIGRRAVSRCLRNSRLREDRLRGLRGVRSTRRPSRASYDRLAIYGHAAARLQPDQVDPGPPVYCMVLSRSAARSSDAQFSRYRPRVASTSHARLWGRREAPQQSPAASVAGTGGGKSSGS
jgi:hypothetical protein